VKDPVPPDAVTLRKVVWPVYIGSGEAPKLVMLGSILTTRSEDRNAVPGLVQLLEPPE
jgi:hypothetical protein